MNDSTNEALKELDALIYSTEYCTEGGLSYDDIDLWAAVLPHDGEGPGVPREAEGVPGQSRCERRSHPLLEPAVLDSVHPESTR